MSLRDIWQQKSDLQLAIAARELDHYEESAQQAILFEIRQRGLERVFFDTITSSQGKLPLNQKTVYNPVYANFWSRFTAASIDQFIVLVLTFIAMLLINTRTDYWGFEIFVVFNWLYSAIWESSSKQATIGKQLLGIKVTDLNGKRISFVQASVRCLGKLFCAVLFFVRFRMVSFSHKKQCIQDIMANTLVVEKEPKPTIPNKEQLVQQKKEKLTIERNEKLVFENIKPNEKGKPEIARVEQYTLEINKSCPHCGQLMNISTSPISISAPSGYQEIGSLQGIKGSWNCLKCDYTESIESLEAFIIIDNPFSQDSTTCQRCQTKLVTLEEAINSSNGFFNLPLSRFEQTDDMPGLSWGNGCTQCVTCDKCDHSFQSEDIFILRSTVLGSSYNPYRGWEGEVRSYKWKYYHLRCLK